MTAPQLVDLAPLDQPEQGVLADRLEELEPRLAVDTVSPAEEALVDERRERVQDEPVLELLRDADELGRLEREPADEDGRARKEGPRRRIEELVAPVDRAAQRLVAGRQVAGAAGQELQPLLEARRDGLRRQELHPRRRELDRERKTV